VKVGVPKETDDGERRVGLVPEGVEKLRDRGLEVRVESGAGRDYYVDQAYEEAGAEVVDGPDELWSGSGLIAKVLPPSAEEVERLPEGTMIISFLQPVQDAEVIGALGKRGATAVSMDAIPRIARAQSMDALSSMSSIGGYKSVLIAANALGRYLPMMTTAAGTLKAGRVLVLGAGVAGLQAIATARRLGAQVTAFDIRPEVKEQIESLGATFLEEGPSSDGEEPTESERAKEPEPEPPTGVSAAVAWLKDVFEIGSGARNGDGAEADGEGGEGAERDGEDAEGNGEAAEAEPSESTEGADESDGEGSDEGEDGRSTGGYASEQTEDKQERDREMIREHLREIDAVITTALVPGKRAPVLLTADMVEAMRPGSVVVDLAAEAGGNCELTRPGEVVEHELVQVHGPSRLPAQMPVDASRLYSRNVVNVLSLLTDEGELQLDFDDEVTDAICLTHGGEVRSSDAREALGQGSG
jgi:H+-translocating NAD(P) transhydrogenase subunit alpha